MNVRELMTQAQAAPGDDSEWDGWSAYADSTVWPEFWPDMCPCGREVRSVIVQGPAVAPRGGKLEHYIVVLDHHVATKNTRNWGRYDTDTRMGVGLAIAVGQACAIWRPRSRLGWTARAIRALCTEIETIERARQVLHPLPGADA